jgi:hypothetical protein
VLGVVLELGTSGGIPFAKKVGAMTHGLGDDIRPAKAVRELGNAVDGSFALDLDPDHDEVADRKQGLVARFVSTFTVVSAAFFSEDSENFRGEPGMGLGKAKELVDSGGGAVDENWGFRREGEVEGKLECATDSGNAPDDVGAIDGASVPRVCRTMDGFHKDLVGAAVVTCDGDTAVQETEEAFDTHGFVVAAGSRVKFKLEQCTHRFEETAKSAAGVDDNCAGEADLQKELLHENMGEVGGGDVREAFDNNHTGKVAHGSEDVSGTVRKIGSVAWLPKVNVEDVERAADWPGKQELAVAADSAVGEDTVGALPDPSYDIGAELWPEETEADAMEGLILLCVRSGGRGVICRKDSVAERGRDNDKQESAAISGNVLAKSEAAVQERNRAGTEVLAVRRVD